MELSQAQQQAVLPPNMLPPGHPDMQANAYYPEPPNDVTGGLPITLDSLRDGPPGSKPFYPYSTLIRYARLRLLIERSISHGIHSHL
jgi:forkhead box protein J2/3